MSPMPGNAVFSNVRWRPRRFAKTVQNSRWLSAPHFCTFFEDGAVWQPPSAFWPKLHFTPRGLHVRLKNGHFARVRDPFGADVPRETPVCYAFHTMSCLSRPAVEAYVYVFVTLRKENTS